MNKILQAELLYDSRKKSKVVAYCLGALFSFVGAHYFYAGRRDYGLGIIVLLILSLVIPQLDMFYIIAILGGVVHTWYVVDEVNDKIRKECELICEAEVI